MTSDPDPRDPNHDPSTIVSAGGIALDELADLQAGLLTSDQERALRARMADDPDALALYGLLEQTRLELADLDDEPVPDDVAQRLDNALAAAPAPEPLSEHHSDPPSPPSQDSSTGAQIVDLDVARRRRRRLVPALIAAAVVVIAIVGGIAVFRPAGPSGPNGLQAGNAPAVGAQDLASLWPDVTQYRDLGPLTGDPQLPRCLARASGGPVGERDILGARPIVVDGQEAVLVATRVSSSSLVALTALGPACSTEPPLAQTLIEP